MFPTVVQKISMEVYYIMYAYISGTVASSGQDSVIVDNGGIGYRVFVPASAAGDLETGEDVKLFTHFSVREDAMLLYGFLTEEDLELFRMLIGVNGVGPKGAMGILSVLDGDALRFAVLTEDAASIAKAPGIGKKTAQKVILELKDKLDLEDAFEKKSLRTVQASSGKEGPGADAVMGLVSLGYTSQEASRAVRAASALSPEGDAEELIKLALRQLM